MRKFFPYIRVDLFPEGALCAGRQTGNHKYSLICKYPIPLNNQQIKLTEFRNTVLRAKRIYADVNTRITKTGLTFGRLRENVRNRRVIQKDPKPKAVVLQTSLYLFEIWTHHENMPI